MPVRVPYLAVPCSSSGWSSSTSGTTSGVVRADGGTTAVVGDNGQGKTNVAEALAYLATLESFRGAPPDALVRVGATQAVVRATVRPRRRARDADRGRDQPQRAQPGAQVNRQRLARARDLLGVLRVTVFSPDDLELVKGGPGERRRFLDDLLVALHPKHDALRSDLERILRQRNTLLKQAGGRLTDEIASTLDVWDTKLAVVGERSAAARAALVRRSTPFGAGGLRRSRRATDAGRRSTTTRRGGAGLAAALAAGRADDVRRQISLVGPHRDELELASTACRRAPTRRRASSAPWPSRCASPATGWSPTGRRARRCSCSTTCCPSSTRHRSDALLAICPPVR